HRPGRFDVPVRFSNPKYEQRRDFLRRLLGSEDQHRVDYRIIQSVASGCKGMSMAFIKLVYETAAARAFKRQEGITVSDDDLLKGFEQAKGYYTQMETPEDRDAGFKAKKESAPKSDDEDEEVAKSEVVSNDKSCNKECPAEVSPTIHVDHGVYK
ncbi:hypothetical protein LCGC14_3078500, partial [marine sediment metagenome]